MNDFFEREDTEEKAFVSEEKVIKMILAKAGKDQLFKEIKRECSDQTGSAGISLSWFLNRYESFPLWLGIRKVPWQRDVFGSLHKRFTKTPTFEAWSSVEETRHEDETRKTGCVFTWPSFGICCIHQYDESVNSTADGMWIVKKLPKDDVRFVIEPFSQLLGFIDWRGPW